MRRLCHQGAVVMRRSCRRRMMCKTQLLWEDRDILRDKQEASRVGWARAERVKCWKRTVWGYFGRDHWCGCGSLRCSGATADSQI
jgi:hypothetical protein